ncbi:gamma-glutamyltransferase [Yoonia sediminilitoris]|uniref:Glutathione hydrolase proenzyme n=1 Tax=Yoonia sediminilitoris TaxID=1286148 RepID=A0A2T6K906_9RHOB|nr:gamma-glutamyltransferase [Yoonia sediminilitoris]PUB11242.1 gamma-glutamyltranspeptidase/glutathione hydrolase [Yoonia sediminilitoris]RCW91058.1 gamma-glutamyltranspeptidase/glutathione hydrolase [Yoonia sediminilitoris]
MSLQNLFTGCVLCLLLTSPAIGQQVADAIAPEDETANGAFENLSVAAQAAIAAKDAGSPVTANDWMIAAANPLAVEAGATILAEGGTAADAMVTVQSVLGLVEPQSSGLGGGAFLVWFDAASGTITTLDGRETAPLAATPTVFQDENGERLGFFDAVVGGLSVGTPGTPKLMEDAHRRWGMSNWASLLAPAIRLAETGFAVSPRMAESIARDAERLQRFPATADYFFPGGTPLAAGDLRDNPAYADTLRQIASYGTDAFYTGAIAEDIVATVRNAEGNPGLLSTIDMALYDVVARDPVCVPYRTFEVCGMGPPSSGALTVGQILGIVNSFDLSDPNDPHTWRLIGDASRLAFADRGRYMADSDYVPMPTKGLVDPAYLAARAELIEGDRTDGRVALPDVAPGSPEWDHAQIWGDDVSIEFPSTSHISIVDSYGNALSMTTTIENGFGSRLFVRGFLLNNELTDFSFATHNNGAPIANRIEPGKRPRSSMAPTIVMQDGQPSLVIGSPGGSRIIGYVAQAIIAHIDWGMDVQQAVSMPHLVNRFGTFDIEEGTALVSLEEPLIALGYEVSVRGLNSGLHAIAIGEQLQGGADPRREGIALGE